VRWILLATCAACGRLGFDASSDAPIASDVADATAPTCTFGSWRPPLRVAVSTLGAIEESPALSGDGLDLYFHRYVDATTDLVVSHRASTADPFMTDAALPINTADYERDPALAAAGHHLYFSSDRRTGNGVDELFVSVDLAAPVVIEEIAAGAYGPWIREDELELWYGDAGEHIAMRTRAATIDPWGAPVNLSTVGAVSYPTLSADGRELVLERGTPAGLFTTRRADRTTLAFDPPRELVEVTSGFAQAGDPELSRDGTELYFDATLADDEDLWVSTRSCL
jgi:hypothetical protein